MADQRCINYPCCLPQGHDGPCSSSPRELPTTEPGITRLRDCWACGTGMDLDERPAKCQACGADDPCGDGSSPKAPLPSNEQLYAVGKRECWKLGEHYSRHSLAMTAEGLDKKSDIAAELAVRDAEIERLQQQLQAMTERKDAVNETLAAVVKERNELRERLRNAPETSASPSFRPCGCDGEACKGHPEQPAPDVGAKP